MANHHKVALGSVPQVHPETALSKVGGRWVAATPDDGVHTFEEADGSASVVGERIIELVDGSRSVEAIVGVLLEEFDVGREVVEGDTLDFIRLLVEKQVLSVLGE